MFGLISGGLSALGGAFQAIQGAKMARSAENELKMLKVPELKNVAEGMQVSTLGADLQKAEAGRNFATGVDALRSGGIRGIVGGLGAMTESQNKLNKEIAIDLDAQQWEIDKMYASDEANIRGMKEDRYKSSVAALSSQINAGRQEMMQGISGALQGVSSGLQMASDQKQFDSYLGALGGGASAKPNPFAGAKNFNPSLNSKSFLTTS